MGQLELILQYDWIIVFFFVILVVLIIVSIYKLKNGNEQNTVIANYFKFLIGSVVLVIITFLINKGLEERTLSIQESEQFGKQIEYFIDRNPQQQKNYVKYFATITRSPGLRTRWEIYYDTLIQEIEKDRRILALRDLEQKKNDSIISFYYQEKKSKDSIAIKHKNDSAYSNLIKLKSGLAKINKKIDSLEFKNNLIEKEKQTIVERLQTSEAQKISILGNEVNNRSRCSFFDSVNKIFIKSENYYNNYKLGNFSYEDATKIYQLNKESRDFIKNNLAYIPTHLIYHAEKLIAHYNNWILGYELLLANSPRNDNNAYFRVIYRGETFPVYSRDMFVNEFKKNCLSLEFTK